MTFLVYPEIFIEKSDKFPRYCDLKNFVVTPPAMRSGFGPSSDSSTKKLPPLPHSKWLPCCPRAAVILWPLFSSKIPITCTPGSFSQLFPGETSSILYTAEALIVRVWKPGCLTSKNSSFPIQSNLKKTYSYHLIKF